jgi:hypothetical protein
MNERSQAVQVIEEAEASHITGSGTVTVANKDGSTFEIYM